MLALLAVIAVARRGDSTSQVGPGERAAAASRGGSELASSSSSSSPATGPAGGSQGVTVAGSLRLEGQVIDVDKQPVGGARVTLGGARVVETEPDGSFAFDGLAEGRYDVSAEHGDGYAEDQNVQLDDTSEPVTLTLVRGPALVVHVVDDHHRPIAGATVEIMPRTFLTGSDGAARFRGVASDDEYVTVSAPGHAGVHERVVTSDDPAETVEWTVVLVPGAEIAGVVVDGDGARVLNASVELEPVHGRLSVSSFADDTGAWHAPDVGAGTYRVRASAQLHIATADLVIEHDGSHAITGVVVRVQLGGEIAGRVVDAAGRPVADARVTTGSGSDTTDASGRFVVHGLGPDTYSVTAATPTLGAASQQVVLGLGQKAELTLVLAPSSLAGIVVDPRGEPVADAKVFARSAAPSDYAFARSDSDGRFDLEGLPPGEYHVVARRAGSSTEGATVEVATTDRHIRLVVPDPAVIAGRVILDGAPVPYFGVSVSEDPGNAFGQPTPVRAPDGRFRQPDAAPGTQAVILIGPGFLRHVVEGVQVVSGATTDLGDIVVARGSRLHGRVVDARGAAVAGATVRIASSGFSTKETRLRAILQGEMSATTDAAGCYELVGLPSSLAGFEIEASHPSYGTSSPRPLAAGASDVTLVLGATP